MGTGMLISVCICTLKRSSVIGTLDSIAEQTLPSDVEIEAIVVDNDVERSAEGLVSAWAAGARIPVTYAVEPERNIALARNRALSLARGEKLAFIDDDEVATPFWLSTLLAAQKRYAADVVIGRVDAIYPPGAARWLVGADPLSRNWGPSGTVCTMGSSANALVSRKIIEKGSIGFDPAFGRTGGEDTDFFGRLCASGAKIVVEHEAVVREWVSPDRLERAYLCRRAIRAGQSYGAVRLRQLSRAGRLVFITATLAKAVTFSACAAVLRAYTRANALKLAIRGWLNFGKLRACAGLALPRMY
jgi:succinoglycan biosynthesis protein ExoM